ncbi:MAG TPA: hypothetical protein ENO27_01315 [Caldithrix sp.]|nr:hypothetical protein [Caldithrix sp.]
MSKIRFAIWGFPIISSIILFSTLFVLVFERPVFGLLVGFFLGCLIGLVTKLIADDFPVTFTSKYESKVRIDDIFLIPHIFFKIWHEPIKRLFKFSIKYILITGAIIIIIYTIIKAIFDGL